MKKPIKIFAILLTLIFSFSAISCAKNPDTPVTIYAPDGAPALSIASLINEGATINEREINVTISDGGTVSAKLSKGETDVAILPVSGGAKLYLKGGDFKLCAVTVWGLNYLVGKSTINSLDELKGKLIHSIGKGDTPDIMFKKVLANSGITYEEGDTPKEGTVVIKYYSAGSEILPLLKNGTAQYAVVGEPLASKAKAPAIGCVEILDLQKEWKDITGVEVVQAGVFVSKSVYSDKNFMSDLLAKLKQNDTFLTQNSDTATTLLKNNGSAVANGTTFTPELIARCNIKTESAKDKKETINSYFTELKSFGAIPSIPNDNFYYNEEN